MAYEYSLEEGEEVLGNFSFSTSRNSPPFCLVVSTRALFLPRTKRFAVSDPTYFEKVPLSRVTQVRITRLSPILMWILAVLMVTSGAALTAIMLWPFLRGGHGTVSGYPPAIFVCGLVIPFIVRRRYALDINLINELFRWKPPMLVDQASRDAVKRFLDTVTDACREAGINVIEEHSDALGVDASGWATPNLAKGNYPLAGLPDDPSKGVLRSCCRCGQAIKLGRWDDSNGFLVRCPHCGGIHGKPWRIYWILLASLLINAFSFFTTLRWKSALSLCVLFLGGFYVLSVIESRFRLSQSAMLYAWGVLLLGPFIINAVVVLRHESLLNTASGIAKLRRDHEDVSSI